MRYILMPLIRPLLVPIIAIFRFSLKLFLPLLVAKAFGLDYQLALSLNLVWIAFVVLQTLSRFAARLRSNNYGRPSRPSMFYRKDLFTAPRR